jgi:hypothetical protein
MATTDAGYTISVPAGCKVLRVGECHFHVCSDNAWLDSGSGVEVELYDPQTRRAFSVRYHTGRDEYPNTAIVPAVDASDADRHAAECYYAAADFVSELARKAGESYRIAQGSRVNVVRGRKVPKGEYEACNTVRTGQYGPYYDLRSADGKYYSYVAAGNVEPIPAFAREFTQSNWGRDNSTLSAVVLAAIELHGKTAEWLKFVAEFIGETHTMPVGPRYERFAPDDFSAAMLAAVAAPSGPARDATCPDYVRADNEGIRLFR